jgi:ribose 5-phosphate isomerase B
MDTVFNKQLPLAIGCDHAGYDLKETLKNVLEAAGWRVVDKGTFGKDSVDYPDYAHPVAEMIASGASSVGILICGSAIGVSITANRHKGVRAAVCWNEEVAALARQHNNANIICLPARFITAQQAEQFINIFLTTQFEGGRHERRVEKMEC